MEKIKEERERRLSELQKSKEQAIFGIQEHARDLHAVLKRLEEEALKDVENAFLEAQAVLEQELSDIENKIYKNHTVLDSVTTETEKQRCENDVMEATDVVFDEIIKSLQSLSDTRIVFTEDNYMKDILTQIEYLGSVLTTGRRSYAYYVSSTSDVNVRMTSDTDSCNVTDVCLIGPRMLLLVDNRNKRLKRFHVDRMSVIDHCDLPAHPYCACATDKREAVVTLSNNILQFVSLGNTMTPSSQIKLKHCCYGVTFKDDYLFITDSSCSVHIYDRLGNHVQSVSNDSSGNNLFAYTRQIIPSDWGKELFVTDWTNKYTVLDTDGNYVGDFSDKSIEQANGITTDGKGNIFVCGFASRNIIQIGPDGKRKGILTKSSENLINHPHALCFVPGLCSLFVTQGNSDKVKVFQLK